MADMGRILIADDDRTFLRFVADLLGEEGYDCTCACDGTEAAGILKNEEYDLLVADIRMPGNSGLELIRALPDIAEGLPAILVTGYPSLSSAVESVRLPVAAYFLKPIEYDSFRGQVRISVESSKICRTARTIRRRLQDWCEGLTEEEAGVGVPQTKAIPPSFDDFVALSFKNMAASLSDMRRVADALQYPDAERQRCHILSCPRLERLEEVVKEAAEVLNKSEAGSKSDRLEALCRKLEHLASGRNVRASRTRS